MGNTSHSNFKVLEHTKFEKTFYHICEYALSNILYDSTNYKYSLQDSMNRLKDVNIEGKKVMLFNDDTKKVYSIDYDFFIRLLTIYSKHNDKINFESIMYSKFNTDNCFQKLKIKDNFIIYNEDKITFNNKLIPSLELDEFKTFAKSFLNTYKNCSYGLIKVCMNHNKHLDSFILLENNDNKLTLTYKNNFINKDKNISINSINYLHQVLSIVNNKYKIFEDINLRIIDDCDITNVSTSLCYMNNLFWIYTIVFIVSKFQEEKIHLPSSDVWMKYYNNFFEGIDTHDYYNIVVYFMAYLMCKNQKKYNLAREIASKEFFTFCDNNMTDDDKKYYEMTYSSAPFDTEKYYEHILCLKETTFTYRSNKKKFLDVCRFNYECESECCMFDDFYNTEDNYNGNVCVSKNECNANYYESI